MKPTKNSSETWIPKSEQSTQSSCIGSTTEVRSSSATAQSRPEFNNLKAKLLRPDARELWEKASFEYAAFHQQVRSSDYKVHTKKLYRLWKLADGRKPNNWPKHREWPITQSFRRLWNDAIPEFLTESTRQDREFQILVLCFANGFTVEDADCVIIAWWQRHDIAPNEMAYRVFRATVFQDAWRFTEPARMNFETRAQEKRQAAKAKRQNNPAKTANRIRTLLNVGPASVDEMIQQLDDLNRATVKKQCQRMAKQGEVEKMASGRYRMVPDCGIESSSDIQPSVALSEKDRHLLSILQMEQPNVDETKFREWQGKEFFPALVHRLKSDYDYLFPERSSEPGEPPPLVEAPKAQLPF